MKATKKTTKRVLGKNRQTENLTEFATKTATSITEAISQSHRFGQVDGKVNVHIHVGDIILIGFDEAIDAEEWGMRENNTEIIGGKASGNNSRKTVKAEVDPNKNKKITRSIQFKKGALQLNALENSEPIKKLSPPKKATKKSLA